MKVLIGAHETTELVPPATWRTVAILGTCATALLAAFVAWSGKLLEGEPPDGGSYRVFQKWRLLDLQKEPVDWLVLGDSSGDTGVSPDAIEKGLGGTYLNLCTMAPMLVVTDAWMLGEYIRRVGKPRNVIVVHVYDVWRRRVGEMLPMLHDPPRPWGYWRRLVPPIDVPLESSLNAAILDLLPPLAKKRAMVDVIYSKFRGFPDLANIDYATRRHGYMGAPERKDPEELKRLRAHVTGVAQGHLRDIRSGGVDPTEENARALERLLALSREHSIPMYFVASPLYRPLWEDAEFRSRYLELAKDLRGRIEASGAPAKYVWDEPPLYDVDQMETVDHVIGDAIADYGGHVANAIAALRAR